MGGLHPLLPLPPLPRAREVPHERQGGLPHVRHHVCHQVPDHSGQQDHNLAKDETSLLSSNYYRQTEE